VPLDPHHLAATRAVVFDAYGTLFDVHSAVARHAGAVGPEAAQLSEIWRSKQLEYSWVLSLAERYEPFWTLTERALDHAFARCPGANRATREQLLTAYSTLDAYPEIPAAVDRLRTRGLRTGILSNGDPTMLRDALNSAGLGGKFDAVLSVEAAGIFKTSPATYQLALDAFAAPVRDLALRLVKPLGHRGRCGVRIQVGLGEPNRHAGRVSRAGAHCGGAGSSGADVARTDKAPMGLLGKPLASRRNRSRHLP